MSNPFKDWTPAKVAEFNARSNRSTERVIDAPKCEDGEEYKLHEFIIEECKRRGWIVFHGSMAHQTFRTKGEPDFVILANVPDSTCDSVIPNARIAKTFLIECKTKTSKVTPDQQAIIHWAKTLGHIIHVVRSEQEFLEVIK